MKHIGNMIKPIPVNGKVIKKSSNELMVCNKF